MPVDRRDLREGPGELANPRQTHFFVEQEACISTFGRVDVALVQILPTISHAFPNPFQRHLQETPPRIRRGLCAAVGRGDSLLAIRKTCGAVDRAVSNGRRMARNRVWSRRGRRRLGSRLPQPAKAPIGAVPPRGRWRQLHFRRLFGRLRSVSCDFHHGEGRIETDRRLGRSRQDERELATAWGSSSWDEGLHWRALAFDRAPSTVVAATPRRRASFARSLGRAWIVTRSSSLTRSSMMTVLRKSRRASVRMSSKSGHERTFSRVDRSVLTLSTDLANDIHRVGSGSAKRASSATDTSSSMTNGSPRTPFAQRHHRGLVL